MFVDNVSYGVYSNVLNDDRINGGLIVCKMEYSFHM